MVKQNVVTYFLDTDGGEIDMQPKIKELTDDGWVIKQVLTTGTQMPRVIGKPNDGFVPSIAVTFLVEKEGKD